MMIDRPGPACRRAVRDALGFPSVMLLAGMMGFGSLARESGMSLGMSLSATAGIWGLPGQVALVELHATGAPILFAVLASSLANVRFMPMAVSFLPLMRSGVRHYGWMYVLVQMLSFNSWVAGQKAFPVIAPAMRARYYTVFGLICISAGLFGTALGYFGVTMMSRPAALGLIFLNPLFFTVLICSTTVRPAVLAVVIGVPLGPVFHMLSPDWGLIATGLTGGTLAMWIDCRYRR